MPYYKFAENIPNYHPSVICSTASCKKSISQKQSVVVCSLCLKLYHLPCKGIIGAERIEKAAEYNWVCSPDCVKAVQNPHPSDTTDSSTATRENTSSPRPTYEAALNNLMVRIDGQVSDIKAMINDIQKSQEFICNEFELIRTESKKLAAANASLVSKCESLQQSNLKLDERMNLIEAQLDATTQKEIKNNIVLCGLPAIVPDHQNYISNIIHEIHSTAEITEIRKMYVNQNSKSTLKNSFIITLKSAEIKNEILSKHRTYRHKNRSSDYFIMQHFTKFQSKMYSEAMKLKRAHSYKYLWERDGKIFLRHTDDSKIHHIFSLNDIFRLEKRNPSQPLQTIDDREADHCN